MPQRINVVPSVGRTRDNQYFFLMCTNCNNEYRETHCSSHVNRKRYLDPNLTMYSVCRTWGHTCMTYVLERLMLEKDIKELPLESNDI